jgi:hypothetical protein
MVGLFFFIRAATKDRTETVQLMASQPPDDLQKALDTYFANRAYQVVASSKEGQVTLSGQVRPSWFLAVFLSFLAAIGALCFALVLATLFPAYSWGFAGLLLLSPAAGIFYWQRAGREEQVNYTLTTNAENPGTSRLTLTAHRDEIIALRQALGKQLAT